MNPVSFLDLQAETAALQPELRAAFERVTGRGSYILGEEVAAFEQEFADFLGVPGRAVGVANGTDAIALALRALGVVAGDRVVTVSFTAVPTVSAIRQIGAVPVFCDVDESGRLDLARLEPLLAARVKALVAVHLYGNPLPMDRIGALCRTRGVAVVEDCAQAHGAQWQGQMAGTFGDIGAFSFYPTKNLGALGDGGCCFTRDETLARRLARLRIYGFERLSDYYAFEDGVNSRLDELQAAFLRAKLRHLPADLAQRRALAGRYERELAGAGVTTLGASPGGLHAYHLFVVRTRARAALMDFLARRGIATKVHYPTPAHRMPAFERFHDPVNEPLARTERLAEEVLSLPLYPHLPAEHVALVAAAIREFQASA